MRRYLPVDRTNLYPDWPLSKANSAFWGELGKTIAAFGYLEHELTSACYTLTTPPARLDNIRAEEIETYLKWYARVETYQTDAMHVLTGRFCKLLKKDGRVPHAIRTAPRRQLDELGPWRNALCHGAWLGLDVDGSGVLAHYYMEDKRIMRFQPRVTLRDLADLRAKTVDATIRVAEASSVAGSNSVLAVVLPRKYEPRNAPPEQE